MTRNLAGLARPDNLDGQWVADPEPDHHGYRYYRAGPVAVRFQSGFEADGELVTTAHCSVHIERMDSGHWWIGLQMADGREVHIDLHSKRRIAVRWREES